VYTRFINMVTQKTTTVRLLPLVVEETEEEPEGGAFPLYEFEPSAEGVLDALLPRYIESRIYNALLQAAASEHAARRRAMKAATGQRGGAHQVAHPAGERRPPGRDHPGDQRDRRRRGRTRVGQCERRLVGSSSRKEEPDDCHCRDPHNR
jgi:hypothetical protein